MNKYKKKFFKYNKSLKLKNLIFLIQNFQILKFK